MSNDDGVYQSSANRDPGRRRKRAILGVVGLAALLGPGAYVVTAQILDRTGPPEARDLGAPAPMVIPVSEPPSPEPSPSTAAAPSTGTTRSAVKQSVSPSPSPSAGLPVDERIRQARERAAEDGYPVQRALTAGPHVASGPVDERTEKLPHGILRVITAKHDLTGQRELLWPADDGKRVGAADCTQNLRFAAGQRPAVRPNLVLCWRTSAAKSVITVLVDQGGKPSAAKAAEVIDREWARLG